MLVTLLCPCLDVICVCVLINVHNMCVSEFTMSMSRCDMCVFLINVHNMCVSEFTMSMFRYDVCFLYMYICVLVTLLSPCLDVICVCVFDTCTFIMCVSELTCGHV